ncbi:hypothetical protein E4U53_007423 [Claviceps sorghi]|nr:hypothetical protein E4U53_007423 [Claviceps sorghi]
MPQAHDLFHMEYAWHDSTSLPSPECRLSPDQAAQFPLLCAMGRPSSGQNCHLAACHRYICGGTGVEVNHGGSRAAGSRRQQAIQRGIGVNSGRRRTSVPRKRKRAETFLGLLCVEVGTLTRFEKYTCHA